MSMHMYHYFIEDRKDIPKSSPFAIWIGATINPRWLELCLPMSGTNLHGPSKATIALYKAIHHENMPIYFDPLKSHFYIVKLGFTGVYIIFLIFPQKHRLWVLVRTASPRRFLRVPTIYVLSRNMKNINFFYLKIFLFWL